MKSVGTLILGLLAVTAGAAETISGRVLSGGAPLANVRVTYARTSTVDTTGADGRFEIRIGVSSVLRGPGAAPDFALRGGRLELENPEAGTVSAALFAPDGRQEAVLFRAVLPAGSHSLSLAGAQASPGLHLLAVSAGGSVAYAKVMVTGAGLVAREGFQTVGPAALRKAAVDGDTLVFASKGYFTVKKGLPNGSTQDVGDVSLDRDAVMVGDVGKDKFDQFILDGVKNHQLDASLGMVIKAMIVIESSFNVQAISMWDTQLPCGTHSYGLIQVTPGCERGYATVYGVQPTASISGGLNGNPAKLTYFNTADQTNGNTIVQENGILIDLVTNAANPLWATSAFNPAYSIDHGAKAVADVMGEMKNKFGGCSAANYVAMTLAGYNQGSSTVSGCTSYSPNGNTYQTNVLNQYRTFCKSAGITPVY